MKIPFPVRAVPFLTFRAWLTPPPVGSKTMARDRDALADVDLVSIGGVETYEVGTGPLVVAVHGWGGRPAQMLPLARRLASDGHRVVIPVLPGHAGGEATDIKQAASAIHAVIDEIGEPEVIVAHSFAAMVLRLAFPEDGPDGVALIAPALNVTDALDVFGDKLRLFPWSRRGLRARLKAWDPTLWPVVSTTNPDVLVGSEMLILHDPDDREASFARSAELAALRPRVTLVPVDGAGHNGILADQAVHDRIANFVRKAANTSV